MRRTPRFEPASHGSLPDSHIASPAGDPRHPRLRRGRQLGLALLVAAASSWSTPALAQAPAPAPAPAGRAPSDPAPSTTVAPARTVQADPMLTTPEPPARTLTSWREAVQRISTRDVEYGIALAEIERARGIRRQALAAALPTIAATGSVTFQILRNEVTTTDFTTGQPVRETVPESPTALAQITARQPILAPRTWWAIGTADAQVDLAKLSIEDRRRTLLAGAADAVVGVVTAERIAEVNRVGLRAALERLELTRRREALGSGTRLDIVRFEQDVALARANLVQGDENLRRSREALGLALGETEPYGVPVGFALDGVERDARSTCKPGDLQDRADLRAAQASIAIAERAITDADLQYLPTAEISTTASLSSELLPTTEHYAWSVQGLLTIPIWDGGARYGAHREAVAAAEQQRLRSVAATRGATQEARQATRAVNVAEQTLEVARTTRSLAAQVAELSQRSFETGTGTSFDLVDAGRRLREAELQLAVRELELVQARLAALLASSSCTY